MEGHQNDRPVCHIWCKGDASFTYRSDGPVLISDHVAITARTRQRASPASLGITPLSREPEQPPSAAFWECLDFGSIVGYSDPNLKSKCSANMIEDRRGWFLVAGAVRISRSDRSNFVHMLLHLFHQDIANVSREIPTMSEGILKTGAAIPVELICERPNDCGAG